MEAKEYKFYRICYLIAVIAMLAIEVLPFSVRLTFSDGTKEFLEAYSYFNVRLFGFAVFFTFPIAILTCGMVATGVLSLFLRKKTVHVLACSLSLLTVIAAVLSLAISFWAVSWDGVCLLLLAFMALILSLLSAGGAEPAAGSPRGHNS